MIGLSSLANMSIYNLLGFAQRILPATFISAILAAAK